MDGERCETCRFWRQEPDDVGRSGDGECRRYPPEHNHGYGIVTAFEKMLAALAEGSKPFHPASETMEWQYGSFPGTDSDWWCGEHRPRTPLPVVPPARSEWTIEQWVDAAHSAAGAVLAALTWPKADADRTRNARRAVEWVLVSPVRGRLPRRGWAAAVGSHPAPADAAAVVERIRTADPIAAVRQAIEADDRRAPVRTAYLREVLAANSG